jgi:hypothetical protein
MSPVLKDPKDEPKAATAVKSLRQPPSTYWWLLVRKKTQGMIHEWSMNDPFHQSISSSNVIIPATHPATHPATLRLARLAPTSRQVNDADMVRGALSIAWGRGAVPRSCAKRHGDQKLWGWTSNIMLLDISWEIYLDIIEKSWTSVYLDQTWS